MTKELNLGSLPGWERKLRQTEREWNRYLAAWTLSAAWSHEALCPAWHFPEAFCFPQQPRHPDQVDTVPTCVHECVCVRTSVQKRVHPFNNDNFDFFRVSRSLRVTYIIFISLFLPFMCVGISPVAGRLHRAGCSHSKSLCTSQLVCFTDAFNSKSRCLRSASGWFVLPVIPEGSCVFPLASVCLVVEQRLLQKQKMYLV